VFHYNQKVYRQGEEPCEVFYVLSGEFRRVDARARHLEYYEMGCLFGEEEIMVLVDGAAAAGGGGKGRRNSSVLCNSTEAVAYSIPRQLF
jgi:CRP-like cAMP-binding protein